MKVGRLAAQLNSEGFNEVCRFQLRLGPPQRPGNMVDIDGMQGPVG